MLGRRAGLSLFVLLMIASCQSRGNWLSLCQDFPSTVIRDRNENYLAHIFEANERIALLQLAAVRPDNPACESREVSVGHDKIAWAGFANRALGKPGQIALQGRERDRRFVVSEIIVNDHAEMLSAPTGVAVKPQPKANVSRFSPRRAAWFWSPTLWQDSPQLIFDNQSALALKRIYITVPVANGRVQHSGELLKFLENAHLRDLQVWAALGDPQAVLETEKQRFLTMVTAYQAFNNGSPRWQRLDGLQLDIEPYLLPGYQLNPAVWLQKQAKIVNWMHQAAPTLAIDMVLPFWFEPLNGSGSELLATVEESIVSITVMNYRTDPEQISAFAEKFLAWGVQRHKAVYIALESLSMPVEEQRTYTQAISGELWRIDFKAASVLLLLQQAETLPGEMGYRFSHSRKIDGSNTSFFRHSDALMSLLPSLENQFSSWTSFAGLALHGHDQP